MSAPVMNYLLKRDSHFINILLIWSPDYVSRARARRPRLEYTNKGQIHAPLMWLKYGGDILMHVNKIERPSVSRLKGYTGMK